VRSGTTPGTVEEYLAGVPAAARKRYAELRRAVRAAAPDAEETISYRMPALRYRGALVYYGAFADHVSLFLGSAALRERMVKELRSYAGGTGTIQFPLDQEIPVALVQRIVRARLRENEAKRG
jgi:uncharacterized protein YdhG (YjbR/CyaY superfamily)